MSERLHQATISVAVMDSRGKLIMECILETKAATILEFIQWLHRSLSVAFRRRNLCRHRIHFDDLLALPLSGSLPEPFSSFSQTSMSVVSR